MIPMNSITRQERMKILEKSNMAHEKEEETDLDHRDRR